MPESSFHLAQINIGTMVAATDDPVVAEFMENLDRINAAADASEEFVWRLQTDSGNATDIQLFANPRELVNMSVWASVESLKAYVYRSEHVDFFRRRAEWFVPDAKRVALFWVPAGEIPSVSEAVRRVEFFERHGASPYAFGFGSDHGRLLFEETLVDDPDTLVMIEKLNAELTDLADDPAENHFSLSNEDVTGQNGRMVRARYDGALVGCGAVRRIEPTVGELKRMFVDDSARGLKIGAAILDRLEMIALSLGMTHLKLETGPRQPAALGLYERAGFVACEPWGDYLATADTSICLEKPLS